jgi:beta-fructofuranosidase
MLRLEDAWIWDSWIADDGERDHLFFLKAPRALADAGLRHTAATIGHASSLDLVDWDVHADALLPDAERWDDLAPWTGSAVRGDTAPGGCTTRPSPVTRATASRTSASASRSHAT